MYADKYRKRNLTPFERQACRNLLREVKLEQGNGGAHIDTCPTCVNVAIQAQCFLCNGACDGNQNCPVMNAQMPAPLEPQPVQQRKPSRWERFCKRVQDWWIGDEQ